MEPKLIARQSNQSEFELHENYPLRLRGAAGRTIEALHGTIWITIAGELTDFELTPGQVLVLPNGRLTLVEAIGYGQVRVQHRPSVGGAWLRWLGRWRQPRITGGQPGTAQHC